MPASDILKRALAADDSATYPVGSGSPLEIMRERRQFIHNAMTTMLDAVGGEQRGLMQSESRDFDKGKARIAEIDVRIGELEDEERREFAARGTRIINAGASPNGLIGAYTNSQTYHRGNNSPSFFVDLRNARRGDYEAAQRLQRNNQEVDIESRALGNTGGTGGSGGEFAPPAWLIEDWVKLARPGRVTADLFHHEQLPSGVSSVNLPKVTGGTTTASQSTQNTTLSQTDMTTSALTSTIVTIGGKQVVSRQLLDQGGTHVDRVILEDLAADYARQIGTQALMGTGTSGQLAGYLNATSTNTLTWTQASPTAAGFYAQLAKLQGNINASRYMPPDAVVMHPRRWSWLASWTDSTGRPLVVPTAGGFNSMANPSGNGAAGHVGSILGMDVYTDPNIPITINSTQDVVLMFPRDDIWLWESPLRAEAFEDTYADSVAVLFRIFGYSAMIPGRYPASLGQIGGSGLTTPVFAS